MDDYRTIRFEMFEVWEDGKGEFPLFVTSDPTVAQEYVEDNPGDVITRRWWVREGGITTPGTPSTRPGESS